MSGLKDRRGPKPAAELAIEVADAVAAYVEGLRVLSIRQQDDAWTQVKKAAAKYRIAVAREKKKQKEKLL